jgi:hypothetical protein
LSQFKIRKCTEAGVKSGGKVKYHVTINYKGTLTIKDYAKWNRWSIIGLSILANGF